ncbi:dynein heavy chain 17, axonemal-like [Acyrthosiphon pisum]|uniref:Dynein heavy chain AAA 5 extension domain-containing protein n=1 Tax=Acyrthosiphon pisum TaxID=7029 RepID=A0A8R2JTX3_ACYPI|nr:dynein heavy chain 17, axonemal-like [Acyrthosiphon pisum]XP_029346454.1 dynein heavy chain 17, axonemal-like [Acyrthosiphon pisum]
MRALRKLTTQKIVTEDTTLFMGLVGDLFITLDVPRTRELEFENQIRQAMVDLKLQHKNNFILKVLTLEINERIALTQTMRLPFDIPNLRSTTPGSVFQAGVLYLNHTDPYVTSWIGTSDNATEKAALLVLLNKYVPICLEVLKTKFKIVTPISEIMHKQMLCTLLDCLSTPINNCPPETARDVYGTYFVFACLWAFGSAIFPDQLIDWRVEFSKWWLSGFKTITISSSGSVLNYFIDPERKQFIP